MAASNPPVNGVAFIVYVALQDMANPGSYKATPTIAAGDFQVSIDGGAFANLATLPTVTPAAGRAVKISLSAGEMTGDNIFIQCVDQTNPKEWADYAFVIQTVAAAPFAGGAVASVTGNVGGNVTGSVGSVAAGGITAASFAADAITAAKIADGAIDTATFAAGTTIPRVTLADTLTTYTGNTPQTGDSFARIGVAGAGLTNIDLPNQAMDIVGNITGNLSGSVGSVTGAVGSVTGAVGSVTGAVGSVAAGGITAASIATDAIDADAIAASAVTEIQSGLATIANQTTINNNVLAVGTAVAAVPTEAANADKLLGRNLAGGSDGGRTVQDALRLLRNKRSIAAGTLTVTAEDDATPAWTATVATAVSNPVSAIDPA